MSQIGNSDLQTILDKLARFVTESVGDPEFADDFNAGMEFAAGNVLSGAGALDTFILALDDVDQVADLLPAARDLDETHPTPPDGFVLSIPGINAMIAGLNAHFRRYGYTGLDNKLTTLNASTPTLRAHGNFRKYLKTIAAKNSFIPNDLVLATFTMTGATTGTYAHVASIDTTKYAGAKLVVKNQGALATSAVVTVTGKKLDGTTASLTATLTTHTDNAETDLSVTTKLFVDVTAISITTGTNANVIEIVAKTDRSIAAA
jgi:hypothetical protein